VDDEKLKRLMAAYHDADLIHADIHSIIASMEVDVPDATRMEIAEAIREAAKRATLEAEVFNHWADEQRKLGRPERELIWGNCVDELNLWRPNTTH
jgi:hypothetical protein